MNNIPTVAGNYGEPPESCAEACQKLCKGKSINELNQIADYFRAEADKLREYANEEVTTDDFNKAKKDGEDEY